MKGSAGKKKFIPKKPAINEIGMNSIVMMRCMESGIRLSANGLSSVPGLGVLKTWSSN